MTPVDKRHHMASGTLAPLYTVFWLKLGCSGAAAPKGTKSCRTQGESVRPSVHLSVHPSVHPSVRPSVRPSIRLSVHPSVFPFIVTFPSSIRRDARSRLGGKSVVKANRRSAEQHLLLRNNTFSKLYMYSIRQKSSSLNWFKREMSVKQDPDGPPMRPSLEPRIGIVMRIC